MPAPSPLAPFEAAVEAARQRMDSATSLTAANLARADYAEAQKTLRGARRSLGIAA
jgi:hypothetical protein